MHERLVLGSEIDDAAHCAVGLDEAEGPGLDDFLVRGDVGVGGKAGGELGRGVDYVEADGGGAEEGPGVLGGGVEVRFAGCGGVGCYVDCGVGEVGGERGGGGGGHLCLNARLVVRSRRGRKEMGF
ncbi:hypothetical protein V499_02274 [Pseudogymnoascus sp. VKM F-103]|nr:hypothetical protein V499_02274 [Pseudogymnoascus sp. VKM F-103]